MYTDKYFDNQLSTLTTTDLVKDKDKLANIELSIVVTLTPMDESLASSPPVPLDQSSQDDSSSIASADTFILPRPPECRSEPCPTNFLIPTFSYDVEMLLQAGNQAHGSDSSHLQNRNLKSNLLEKLAEAIFCYTAYPTGLQRLGVIAAL